MGLKGRKRRLESFGRRAISFWKAVNKGTGFEEKTLDSRAVKIGKGPHKRLIFKTKRSDLRYAKQDYNELSQYYRRRGSQPKKFVLVEILHKGNVQEFFHRPSLHSLSIFLGSSEMELKKAQLTRDSALLCKQFANQHRQISLQKLEEAIEELKRDYNAAITDSIAESLSPDNVIVLGQNRDGRLRLAIVDV